MSIVWTEINFSDETYNFLKEITFFNIISRICFFYLFNWI